MTDSEIVKRCADAMGIGVVEDGPQSEPPENWLYRDPTGWNAYDPLHDDAQAMALVKKFGIEIHCREDRNGWYVGIIEGQMFTHADLNHAICHCVSMRGKP